MRESTHKHSVKGRPVRVFIIGAGVSASCGIATSNRILRDSMKFLAKADSKRVAEIHKLLSYLYPSFDSHLRNYPNIEDFLNLLEMAKRFNTEEFIASIRWSTKRLDEVLRSTLKATTDYIWDRMGDGSEQQLIREFARYSLREGDAIITFNWDLTFERALEDSSRDGFLYTYSKKGRGKNFSLLKPHGSIDWFEKDALRGLACEKVARDLGNGLCYYPRFSLAKNPELRDVAPVIVPPLTAKDFRPEYIKRTWRFVFRALSDAAELHIIGYSLPREDQFARFVIRRAIRNNIAKARKRGRQSVKVRVVNPDPMVEGTVSRLVGREVGSFDFRQAYFEDYVESLHD